MRKPYHTTQASNWFMAKPFYQRYMLREVTCIPMALYVLNLMSGVAALATSQLKWLSWIEMQKSPLMILFTVLTLVAALFNTYTWFETTPKVMKVQQGDKFVPEKTILGAHWAVFAVLALILLIITIACA